MRGARFFAIADLEENLRRKASGKKKSRPLQIAVEVARRIDALLEIERSSEARGAADAATEMEIEG